MNVWTKRPAEAYSEAIEFATRLPTGATLVSGTVGAIVRSTGADATSTILASPTATISGTKAIFGGKAGTSPVDYLITLTVTLSDGSILVEEVLLQVRLAMALIATAGAVNANSYCTLIEADAYHQVHLYNSTWLATDDWRKEAALIWATRLLDEQVEWQGTMHAFSQPLFWPRFGVYRSGTGSGTFGKHYAYYAALFDATTIPEFLKNATAELARYLLIENRTEERGFGISEVTADTVRVVFDKRDVKPMLPPSVTSIVARYGRVQGPGSMTVPLVRV